MPEAEWSASIRESGEFIAASIAPGKRPLSSMASTIVKKDGKVFVVVGSPGGSRIITIMLQTVLNVIDYGMTPQDAVGAPRVRHQWLPDEVYCETRGLSPDTPRDPRNMGYKMVEQTPWGAAELILVGLPGTEAVSHQSSGNILRCPATCGSATSMASAIRAVRPVRRSGTDLIAIAPR